MATIEVGEDCFHRLQAFKPVVEAVINEKMQWQDYVEVIVQVGLTKMLTDIVSNPDAAIATVLKLAELEPDVVYTLMVKTWENLNADQQAETKERFGFDRLRPEHKGL